ncbi:MAG: hypothetical protein PHD92_04890 [Eubacteriales bacterium]|jgi:hypothetical protein|nr:hypothetical protein [Eubacteriales bacterium]
MAKPTDILLTDDGDLMIELGDFVLEDTSAQNQRLLLQLQKGEVKQHPTAGVGIANFLLDDASVHEIHAEIQEQFEADGMKVNIAGNTIKTTVIRASYE